MVFASVQPFPVNHTIKTAYMHLWRAVADCRSTQPHLDKSTMYSTY